MSKDKFYLLPTERSRCGFCKRCGKYEINIFQFSYEPKKISEVINHEVIHSVIRTHCSMSIPYRSPKKILGEEIAIYKMLKPTFPNQVVRPFGDYAIRTMTYRMNKRKNR